jgi:tripartite-type tricarboxylate transporter receptor subunit TctC
MSSKIWSPALRRILFWSIGLLAAASTIASAQTQFPNRPITLIVPYGPGGETDIFARALSNELGEVLGQPIVIVNRPGATGAIGTEFVARSKADGYTLIFGTAATHALNLSTYKTLSYDPLKDFEPIAFVGMVPIILYAHPSMPGDPREFVAKLKANPAKMFYGSAGLSMNYLGMELFMNVAEVSASHVPFKGNGEVLQGLMGGQIHFMGGSLGSGRELVKAGKLRAIAVMSDKRLAGAPDLPTLLEATSLPLSVGTWNVVMAPAGTPREAVLRLNSALNQVLNKPAVQERLSRAGITPVTDSTPASTARFVASEIDKWRAVFKQSGAMPQ